MKTWLLAARPKTLAAAVIPIMVGTALAQSIHGSYNAWLLVFALCSTLCIQIATNILNDALDFKKGADREDRLGPLRVTQSGMMSQGRAMTLGFFFLFMALLFGVPLVMQAGWPIVAIGLVSLFFAYGYTGGPFPLAYLGLGDLFVFLFFGLVAVMGVYFLHSQEVSQHALVAGAQIGMLSTVLIAINNLRDIEQDRISKKHTMAVRFGKNFVRYEILTLLTLTYALSCYWAFKHYMAAALLSLLTIPFAISVVKFVFTNEPSAAYNKILARSAQLLLLFGILLSFGLLLKGHVI